MDNRGTVTGLTAVILAVTDESPRVLVVRRMSHDLATPAQRGALESGTDSPETLPFGPFDPVRHRTLELGLRQWVEEQTGLNLQYVEQLYTFGDAYRDPRELRGWPRVVSVGYLALTRESSVAGSGEAEWRDWYSFLPWEDMREGAPKVIDKVIKPGLRRWVRSAPDRVQREQREERVSVCFGFEVTAPRDPVRTLERYELLYEAGLVIEAHRDRRAIERARGTAPAEPDTGALEAAKALGAPMALDNRRILATALGRIRGKLAYRPLVFQLLPTEFTLFRLQRVVEALTGMRLHKQNFRRMLMAADLVEPTGRMDTGGRGRPAELYRFRHGVTHQRTIIGMTLPSLPAAE